MDFDVVVLGTGAAGLTAAITAHDHGARAGVFEKADRVGGTSAWSGGQVWIPDNHHMVELGRPDSKERAFTYLMALSHGLIDPELIQDYLQGAPEMVRFLDERTPVEFYAVDGMPDYHPEFEGGNPDGGRTIECPLYSYRELGEWAERVWQSPHYPGRVKMTETSAGAAVPRLPSEEELARREAADERGCGMALVGRLLKACLDRGIEPVTGARGRDLVIDDGKVVGVVLDTEHGSRTVSTRNVILATGGFEWNEGYVRDFLRGPMTHPVSVPTNTGDGLRMAMKAGAALGNMREAWWMPALAVPETENSTGSTLFGGAGRALPHAIMINKRGRRFVNEASNYNSFGSAFHEMDVSRFEYRNLPCWSIFDQQLVDRFGFGRFSVPGTVPDWVVRADTLSGLAEKLGVPAGALTETVDRWNACVASGFDSDFLRGESAFDRWWGDPHAKGKKEGTLGDLRVGPFYAVEVHSGCLGTKGGPKTDANGQVLDVDGELIEGLYAAGNVMASVFGMTYGGPGGTLGPGMVFGFRAGRHAAENATLGQVAR